MFNNKFMVPYYNKASIIIEYLECFNISSSFILLLSYIPLLLLFCIYDNTDSTSSIINKSGLISRFNLCSESIYITNRLFYDRFIIYCLLPYSIS